MVGAAGRATGARLQDFYLNHGYVTASVGEPRIAYVDGRAGYARRSR